MLIFLLLFIHVFFDRAASVVFEWFFLFFACCLCILVFSMHKPGDEFFGCVFFSLCLRFLLPI